MVSKNKTDHAAVNAITHKPHIHNKLSNSNLISVKMKTNPSCYKNFPFGLAKAILLPFMFLMMFLPSAKAQDYIINRGDITNGASSVYGYNLCIVDKNEYYQTYKTSQYATDLPISVSRYKNGIVSDWGSNTQFANGSGTTEVARDSANQMLYLSFF
jgi:hypothetical protein